jgi:pilus assembly protein CpaE
VSAPADSLALVSPDLDLESRLRYLVGGLYAGDLRRWRDEYRRIDPTKVAAELAEDGARVVCLGPELDEPTALGIARAFDLEHPGTIVVLITRPTATLWEAAMRAGVRAIVLPDAPDAELRAVLHEALEHASRRAAAAPPEQPARANRVVVVLSPKGGSGKTVVAVNLAVALAQAQPGDVALVDLDLQFGDCASSLHVTPESSMVDVARTSATLDATSLKVFLTPHPSGLWILAAPDAPADAEDVTGRHVADVLRLLAAEFPFTIVDTGAGLDEHALTALELATDVLVVASMDVASVRGVRKELDALDSLGITGPRRHLLLNRADARVGLSAKDVEAVLGMTVDFALPSTRAVPAAVNQGLPLVESDPRAPITRQLQLLAARFAPRTAPVADNGWLRRRKDAR